MSDLLPGQKFNKLLTDSLRDAYDKGVEQGKKRERQRIIKLIQQHERDINWTETHFKYSKALWTIRDLIKGEQK
jgi:hypothetical protein